MVSVFVDVLIFLSNVHNHAAAFGPEPLYRFKPNYTAWSKCVICVRML